MRARASCPHEPSGRDARAPKPHPMDFFEAQARAKKRTSRLLILFALAVAGTIAAAYFAAIVLLHYFGGAETQAQRLHGSYYTPSVSDLALWQPSIFSFVGLGTVAVVGLASLYKWNQYSSGG